MSFMDRLLRLHGDGLEPLEKMAQEVGNELLAHAKSQHGKKFPKIMKITLVV